VSTREPGKSADQRSKLAKKDRVRRQEEARRIQAEANARTQRRRRTRWIAGGSGLVLLVAVIVGLYLSSGTSNLPASSSSTTEASSTLATTGSVQPTNGITLSSTSPPWPIPADAAPYIGAAGLHVQKGETLQVHYHAHVDIIDDSQAVTVPAGIGFLIQHGQAVGLTSLHTHDTSGIVHIESATDVPYTLGQVFTQWGVRLTTGQVGGLVTGNGKVVRAYVNGSAFTSDPATIVLRPHQEIALWYGSTSSTPQVPSSYAFPAGD
jgi:hypothetical protein